MLPLLAAAALGFAPVDGHRTQPVAHLPRTPARQLALSDDPALRALSARWGGGWFTRHHEATGLLAGAWLPGIPVSRAHELAADLAGDAELELVSEHRRGEGRILSWRQVVDGVPVWGSEVALFALDGRIAAARLHLHNPPSRAAVAGAEWWFPHGKSLVPAILEEEDGEVRVYGPGGGLLTWWSTRHYATVTHDYEARSPFSSTTEGPVRGVEVQGASSTAETDATGSHALSDPWDLQLAGTHLQLRRWNQGVTSFSGLEGDVHLVGGEDLTWPEADAFAHLWIVRDWLEDLWPDHPLLGVQMDVTVERSDAHCNAWYSGGAMTFLSEGWGCQDLARVADVVYHEYGHGVHHYSIATGTFAGDISEGAADYISATLTGDPRVGLGYASESSYIRDIDGDHTYPDDVVGEVHYDGLIFASFMWNLRAFAVDLYGEEAGVAAADALLLGTLEQGPSMTTVGDAVILADDDDGDLTNGTPHACDLVELLDHHGLGPGPIGVVVFEHEPPQLASSWDESYPLDFVLADALPDCSGLDRDSVRLWWTTDEVGDADLADPFEAEGAPAAGAYTSAGGAAWTELALTEADSLWSGELERQLAGTRVRYFMEARAVGEAERVTTHDGDLDALYSLWVGDRATLWCEDFESNAPGWIHGAGTPWTPADGDDEDEWEIGEPEGQWWDPEAAWTGSRVAGTVLTGDGQYRHDNSQFLQSPEVALEPGGRQRMVAFRRWLTVEDALYDHARLYLGEALIWENAATVAGGVHHLDRRWTEHTIPLGDEASVQLTFTLHSDAGLEYGGWTLDDVCVVQLADVPGHYRVRDLEATDDGEVEVALTWTNPWIAPLDTVVVVRKREGWPADRTDGVVVFLDEAPEPGAAVEAVDAEVLEGESFHYAVFTSVAEGEWYDRTVLMGENADHGGVPAPPPVDTGDPPVDTGPACADTDECGDCPGVEEPGGCACGPGAGAVGWWVLPALLAAIRRRRRVA